MVARIYRDPYFYKWPSTWVFDDKSVETHMLVHISSLKKWSGLRFLLQHQPFQILKIFLLCWMLTSDQTANMLYCSDYEDQLGIRVDVSFHSYCDRILDILQSHFRFCHRLGAKMVLQTQ